MGELNRRNNDYHPPQTFMEYVMRWSKILGALLGFLVMVAGAGWGASEYMVQFGGRFQEKLAAKSIHEQMQRDLLIAGTQLQFVQDTQIEALTARIDRLRELQRKRELTASEKDDLEFFRKELERAKAMRRVK